MLIQILISLFALLALINLISKKKKALLKNSEFVIWLIFWLAVGIIVWIPNLTNIIATHLGIGRGADLVLYASVIILFYLIFKIYVKLEKMERNITKVVRRESLENPYSNNTEK